MSGPKQSFGGSWTAEKIERLRKYLAAYVQIMKGQPWCEAFCYIDAFAGTGYNQPRTSSSKEDSTLDLLPELAAPETLQFLGSSVRNALEIQPPFTQYVFIEKSAPRAAELLQLKDAYPALSDRISVHTDDANSSIQKLCQTWDWSKRRAVLFLDPFGMQVNWSTIEAVARTGAIDMWLLFPAGIGVNRMLPGHGNISQAWSRRLDAILGVPEAEWYPEFYKSDEADMFGVTALQKTATIASIGDFFVKRLKTVFPAVAEKPLALKNDSGTVLYLLCFAAKNATALKIAKDVLKP
jgi:three-Cys-motif partner protein